MARIGIFGGTFHPIHCGHLKIARAALEQYELDQILFMPAGTPPHKQIDGQVTAQERLDMVKAAVEQENHAAGKSQYAVSDYEIMQKGKSYTYKTLTYFCEKFPNNQYYFLIGEDSLRSFSTWRYPQQICQKAQILVAVRQKWNACDMRSLQAEIANKQSKFGNCFHLLETENFPISSTEIRQCLYQGIDVSQWLPTAVCDYISEHGLYKKQNHTYDLSSMEHLLEKELNPGRYRAYAGGNVYRFVSRHALSLPDFGRDDSRAAS